MSFAAQHASALATVKRKGVAMTISGPRSGTVTASTARRTGGSTPTVLGYGVRVKGRDKEYEGLNLVQTQSPTVLFVPSTFGQEPPLNGSTTFGGEVFAISGVNPVNPDGRGAVFFRLVLGK